MLVLRRRDTFRQKQIMKVSPIATLTGSTTNPKSLVMLDAAGKMATLKLTTSTGLHVYDGQMLWVNPAQSVTAAAPKTGGTGPQSGRGCVQFNLSQSLPAPASLGVAKDQQSSPHC